jgi:hypothetical protein
MPNIRLVRQKRYRSSLVPPPHMAPGIGGLQALGPLAVEKVRLDANVYSEGASV